MLYVKSRLAKEELRAQVVFHRELLRLARTLAAMAANRCFRPWLVAGGTGRFAAGEHLLGFANGLGLLRSCSGGASFAKVSIPTLRTE